MAADRSTIKAVVQEIKTQFDDMLVADPPTLSKPFRKVIEGEAGLVEYARPFITVKAVRAKPIGVTDDDKVMEVTVLCRLVTDVVEAGPTDALFDKVAAVDDYFDSIIQTGLIHGAEGLDNRSWEFGYPKETSGVRVAYAECMQTFVVKVAREANQ